MIVLKDMIYIVIIISSCGASFYFFVLNGIPWNKISSSTLENASSAFQEMVGTDEGEG